MHAIAVGFDFDHTLGFDNRLEIVAFVQLAHELATSADRTPDEERARRAIERAIGNYRAGKCSLDEAVARALEDTMGNIVDADLATNAFRRRAVEMAPEFVRPMAGAVELLHKLDESSIPYAILTNGWNPLQQRKADCIGFTEPVFVSDDLGVRKPSIAAFSVLVESLGVPADRIWYVGDDPVADVLGSLGAGMRAIWFNSEHHRFPTNIPAPTAIVTDIRDIVTVLPQAVKE